MEFITKNKEETYSLAAKIAAKAEGGDIFALRGNLGAGKTTFVQGFAKALGIKKTITSPTFVLMKQYEISNGQSAISHLIHVDSYRMESSADAEAIGLTENFSRPDVVILIEWPEKISGILPPKTKHISFEYIDEESRKINILNS